MAHFLTTLVFRKAGRGILFLILFALVTPAFTSGKENLTADQIIDRVQERPQPDSLQAQFQMVLVNKRDEKRRRKVEMMTKEDSEGQGRLLIRFLEPADVADTSFLVLEQNEGDDVQVMYIPALKKTRRISSQQRSESFMGTDFSYGDIASTDVEGDASHRLLGSEEIDGQDTWKIESIPAEDSDSSYSKIVNWVRKDNYIPIKADFYDEDGELLKQLTVRSVEKVGDYWFTTQSQMHNVQENHRTFLVTPKENIKVDVELADDLFTERAMMR